MRAVTKSREVAEDILKVSVSGEGKGDKGEGESARGKERAEQWVGTSRTRKRTKNAPAKPVVLYERQ